MTGPSAGEVLALVARLIETHQAARAAGEAVRADVTKATFDGYYEAERVWEGALADLVAVGLPHAQALAAAAQQHDGVGEAGWVSVQDQLPAHGVEAYVVEVGSTKVVLAHFCDWGFGDDGKALDGFEDWSGDPLEVQYWMPIPALPAHPSPLTNDTPERSGTEGRS